MDNSIVAMEESHQISDFVASASKLGSLVQINSIAIDISTGAVEQMEAPTHEHFSIRGFVAGMRKKNPKTCLPFASEFNDADPMDYLPPLLALRFRWWQCSNCVPDIAMKSTKEMVETDRSDIGTSSCQNVGENTGLFLHSMEKIGNKLGLRDNADEGEKYPGSKQRTNVTDKEAGSSRGMPEANPLQIRERLNNPTDASDMVCVAENPSGLSDKPGNASLRNDGTFSALPHRKKPKLRCLADILVEEKNRIGDNPKAVQITSTDMETTVLGPRVELDVPADITKASRSPERKRKIALDEDRGPLGLIFSGVAKRIKGLTLDAEKKCKRIETSDTKSEGDASMRLAQRTKPKRNKALDIRKKMKQTHTENGTVSMRELPKISVTGTANLQNRDVSQDTCFGKLGEMGAYFRSILSGQQMQRISNNVSNKTPEVGADDDTLMPNSKGILDLSLDSHRGADRNSNSEASLVQDRDIPDLNVEFHQKTTMTQVKQFSAVSEKRNLPLHKTLFFQDVSASSSKEKAREGKNKLGFAKPRKKDSNMELGASDDIPMEIVELLAKNQHERALENSRRHINNSPRGYHATYVDEHPDTIYFPPLNRKNGLIVANRNMGFQQNNISANFLPLKNSQLDMTKPEESQFRMLTSSTPSESRKTQFSTSSSAELLWPPPTRENVLPFCLSVPHNHSIQHNSIGKCLFSDQHYKGKTVCDIKDGQDKTSMLKVSRIVSGSTSIGSLDPYTNDTIPAMQLLSLMDQQVVSGSSFELGTKSFLDKSFSPCAHHAWLNGKENHNFLGGSFFPQNSHSKDFSGLGYGVYSSGESSKKVPSYLQGQVPLELVNSKSNPLKSPSILAIQPARSNLALGVCTLNRNPADFSIPDARNEFTISAKDLKPRKRNVSKEKSHLVNGEVRKRQRMKKDATG